jgi:hypothetical protein
MRSVGATHAMLIKSEHRQGLELVQTLSTVAVSSHIAVTVYDGIARYGFSG